MQLGMHERQNNLVLATSNGKHSIVFMVGDTVAAQLDPVQGRVPKKVKPSHETATFEVLDSCEDSVEQCGQVWAELYFAKKHLEHLNE